jgi:hypothetical protein
MPPCIDCYTLVDRRDAQTALAFLNTFLPRRRSLYAEHHLPRDAEVAEVALPSDERAMRYLEAHPDQVHTIYTVAEGSAQLNYAMVGYTRDGKMTLGVSCEESQPEVAAEYLRKLQAFAGTSDGYCDVEKAPPETVEEYREEAAAFNERAFFDDPV